jgi:hypothetical protein
MAKSKLANQISRKIQTLTLLRTNGQIEFSLNLLARKYNTTISEILSSLDKLEVTKSTKLLESN